MNKPRWPRESWLLFLCGLFWGAFAIQHGFGAGIIALVPTCILVAAGVSQLLWPGDLRIPQYIALAGVLGVLGGVLASLLISVSWGLGLILASVLSFVLAGTISVRQEPHFDEVPAPSPSAGLSAKVAADDALLATMVLTMPLPHADGQKAILKEVRQANELFEDSGWLEKPERYHQNPPVLERVQTSKHHRMGFDYEHIRFESGYLPHAEEPGRDRWLSYSKNREGHALMLRHPGHEERPWLIAIHGYQMGYARLDLLVFGELYRRFGFNVLMPTLPFHGPRKEGRRSGDGYISGNHMDSVHAAAQAMWDIRRLTSWLRNQGAERIGVHGLSLGGYHCALFSALQEDLACAIPGIPLSCFTRVSWRHGPPLWVRYIEKTGLPAEQVENVLRVVSPLHLKPKVPLERRYIFGAISDRLVPPDHVRDLWLHWEKPRIVWYQGGHVSFRSDPGVRRLLRDAFTESELIQA